MNYLAHLFLSKRTPESLIGNLLGDFVKGSIQNLYTEEIRQGITLHRRIDSYTDSHPIFRTCKQWVSLNRRRFAGIMIDIFYDHFLAKHWEDYSTMPLSEFSCFVYKIFQDHQAILPASLQRLLPDIIHNDWLTSYQEVAAIDHTLKRMATRIKRPNDLANGVEDLQAHYLEIESSFQRFFPDLMNYTQTCQSSVLTNFSAAEFMQ